MKCIENEIPFEVPTNWAWARLRNICMMAAGKAKPANQIKATPFEGGFPCFGGNGIRGYVDEYNQEGTFSIIGRQGALCGNINTASGKFYATEHAVVTTLFSGIDFNWSNYILEAMNLNKYATGAAQPGLSVANVLNVFVPVPPTQEQERIGKKILESIKIINIIKQEKLNLQTIVSNTKAKILDLAIRGKLVPQNSTDEPASALLERIRQEKEELIKQGKIKRDKKESIIFKGEDNSYYAMINGTPVNIADYWGFKAPNGWAWITLKDIAVITSGKTPKSNQLSINGSIPYFKVSDMNTPGNELYLQYSDYYINDLYSGPVFDGGSFVFPKNGGAVLTNKKRILANVSVVDLNTGVFTPSNFLNKDFIFFLFSSIDFSKIYKGAIIPTVDASVIGNLIYGLPPIEEQKRIADIIKTLFTQLEQIEVALS